MKTLMLKVLPACIATLAIAVLVGWIAGISFLIQVSPAFPPMQVGTATCFLMLSIALYGNIDQQRKFRLGAIGLSFLISGTAFLQFVLDIDLGVDRFLGSSFVVTKTAVAGRMSRGTSLVFVMLSVSSLLFYYRTLLRRRTLYLIISGSIYVSLIFSLSNFCVYFMKGSTDTIWDVHTGMAIHTSIEFIILSLIAYYRNFLYGYNRHEVWAPHNALLVLFLGCVCSIGIWRHTIAYEAEVISEKLIQDSRLRATVIQRQFEEDVAKIQATERLFGSSSFVTAAEFRSFVYPLIEEDHSILAIDWSPRISSDAIADFERKLKKQFKVSVRQLGEKRELIPHKGADVYYPVLYTFPEEFPEKAIGFDHYSDGLRTRVMDRAAKEGGTIASEPFQLFRLPRETMSPVDVLVVVPVLQRSEKLRPVLDASSTDIQGFVIGVFRLSHVINQSLKGLGLLGLGIELGAEFDDGSLTTIYRQSVSQVTPFEGSFLPQVYLVPPPQEVTSIFASRKFILTFKASSFYVQENINRLSTVIFIACLVITFLTALYLASIQVKQEELIIQKDSLSIALFEKQSALQSLQQSEALFRQLSESAPIGIFQLDSSGSLEYVNRAWKDMTGLSLAKSRGSAWLDTVHSEDRSHVHVAIQNGIGSRQGVTEKFRFVHENGSTQWVVCNLSPIQLADGTLTGFVGSLFDITEVQRLIEHLKIATAAKSEFLANMSHELRTPMNSIIGFTQLMLRSTKVSLPERHRDALKTIEKNGRHLLRLVNEILDLSKIESGEMKLYRSEFDLSVVLEEVIATLQPQADKKKLTVRCSCDLKEVVIYADETKFRQIFTNLVSNAIRYTDKGTVDVTMYKQDLTIAISVQDTGIGIASEDQKKLFKNFTQLEGAAHRREGGTGLGLSIAKNFIELHGGTISVESEPGKGTTFTARFPTERLVKIEELEDDQE